MKKTFLLFCIIAFASCNTPSGTFKGNVKITSVEVGEAVIVKGTVRVKTNTVQQADSLLNEAKKVIQFSHPVLDTAGWYNSDFILTTPKIPQ